MLLFALMQMSTATKHARQSFHIITHTLAPPSHPQTPPFSSPRFSFPKLNVRIPSLNPLIFPFVFINVSIPTIAA